MIVGLEEKIKRLWLNYPLWGCYSCKVHEPVICQPWIVNRFFVLKPCKLFVQALLSSRQRRQWSYLLTQRWSPKIYHWKPGFHTVGHYPMLHTFEPSIGHYLQPINPPKIPVRGRSETYKFFTSISKSGFPLVLGRGNNETVWKLIQLGCMYSTEKLLVGTVSEIRQMLTDNNSKEYSKYILFFLSENFPWKRKSHF